MSETEDPKIIEAGDVPLPTPEQVARKVGGLIVEAPADVVAANREVEDARTAELAAQRAATVGIAECIAEEGRAVGLDIRSPHEE